jgi:LPXTG-site transpeptidase (sortase) family protein
MSSAKQKNTWLIRTLYALAALVFVACVGIGIYGWLLNGQAYQQVQKLQHQAAANDGQTADQVPVEDKPKTDTYQVAADLPKILSIDKLGVTARIKPLGVDKDNALLSPANIYDVGWYNASSKPGDTKGAMLIDGHVSGPTQHGVFYNIKQLTPGDKITVERGDGTIFTFKVVGKDQVDVDKVDMAKALRSADPSTLGLTLITCGGKFDVAANHYLQRVVIYAVLEH